MPPLHNSAYLRLPPSPGGSYFSFQILCKHRVSVSCFFTALSTLLPLLLLPPLLMPRSQTQATGRLSVAPAGRPSDPLCLPLEAQQARRTERPRGPRGPILRASPTDISPSRANGTSRGGSRNSYSSACTQADGHIAAQSRLDSPSVPQCLVSSLLGQSIVSGCCELYRKSASCDESSISVRGGSEGAAQQSDPRLSLVVL